MMSNIDMGLLTRKIWIPLKNKESLKLMCHSPHFCRQCLEILHEKLKLLFCRGQPVPRMRTLWGSPTSTDARFTTVITVYLALSQEGPNPVQFHSTCGFTFASCIITMYQGHQVDDSFALWHISRLLTCMICTRMKATLLNDRKK